MNPLNASPIKPQISSDFIDSCTQQWVKMQKDHKDLFTHSGIQELCPYEVIPPMPDIDMDAEDVMIVSTKTTPYLGTSGVATCFAVAAKGQTPKNEIFIALAHMNLIKPREVLERMTLAFERKGCSAESVEFYIIGGMLPLKGFQGEHSSFKKQKEFINLMDEYNIQGARFNLVEGEGDESLTAIMSAKGLFWSLQKDVFSSEESLSSEETSYSESSSEEEQGIKRKRDS